MTRVQTLKFTTGAIGSQLKEDGWLLTREGGRHLTVKVSIRRAKVRMWRLKANVFDDID